MSIDPAFRQWIDHAKAVRLETILRERNIKLKGRGNKLAGPCPVCGGTDRFAVHLGKQVFNCRCCGGSGGGAISLMRFIDACDFLRAVETLAGPPPDDDRRESDAERRGRERIEHERRERVERERQRREEREAGEACERRGKARWLWSRSVPIVGTIGETYLREVRKITCALPATLRYLPARKPEHHPAMIAAFALPDEPDPGQLGKPGDVGSVHLTLLRPDGNGKADVEPNKLMVGSPGALPIIVAPPNDLLGMAITEGIEDALSAHASTGLGAWAAGSASRMPKLAGMIPSHIEAVTIFAHADAAGRKGAGGLAAALRESGIEVTLEGLP
jgi:hypothetical protein